MQDRFKLRTYIPDLKFFKYWGWIEENHYICLGQSGDYSMAELLEEYTNQCTGLKDKNGRLIYEGDIIVIPNQYPFYDYKNEEDMKQDLNETQGEIKGESILNYVGIVEQIYSSWQYVYHCVNPKKRGISEGINHLLNEVGYEDGAKTDFEIIGNVYGNPELLEVKNE